MKVKDLKEMTVPEMDAHLDDIKKEQFKLRLQKASGKLENPARITELRRTVARIKTLRNMKMRV